MALKQLILTRDIAAINARLSELIAKETATAARRSAWKNREAEGEKAFGELGENPSEEARSAFDAEAGEIEREDGEITAEEKANADARADLEKQLETKTGELNELNSRAAAASQNKNTVIIERGDKMTTTENRAAIREMCTREDVKAFLSGVRNARGITNANLTIPTVMLPTLRDGVVRNSQLYGLINVRQIRGEGKQNIVPGAPEAVWTDTLGKLNELSFSFNQVKVDGSKVAGYIPIGNPTLEDSDENLASLILDMLGQSIGYALDKAIVYGTGTNMPVGIVTRLAAAASPTWWGTNEPTFTNISTTHIGKLSAASVTGAALYKELITILGTATNKYSGGSGEKFWVMSDATWMKLQTELLSFNAAGSVVTGASMVMPVLGGKVILRDFIPVNNIVGGYGNQYLLGERAGISLRQSEHVKFIEDNTVFAATARYDGRPVAGEGFAAFSISTTAVTTSVTFATDSANAIEQG